MVDNFALLEPVHKAFEQQVRRTPQRTAIIAGAARTTYSDLNAQANRIAHELIPRGVGRGSTVGVCLNRDETLIAALLGVWKTGAAYVPLDSTYPADRLGFIVEDAGVSHTVTSAALSERLPERGLVLTDTLGEHPWNDPDLPSDPADLAYLIYTSGSTGRPKGVAIEHRNVMTLLRWDAGHFTVEERSLASTSVCFDPLRLPALPPPAAGRHGDHGGEPPCRCTRCPARDEVTHDQRRGLGADRAAAGASALGCPYGALQRREPVSRALADRVFANPGVRRMVNLYGPTECTVPLLRPGDLQGRDGRAARSPAVRLVGAVGARRRRRGARRRRARRAVGGRPLVGRGYLNRPELTAERFVTRRRRACATTAPATWSAGRTGLYLDEGGSTTR